MHHDELDIRSSILRKLGRHREALRCSREALSRKGISADSRVLLEMGVGEAMDALDREDAAQDAYDRALEHWSVVRPTTSVRLYRSYASHLKRIGNEKMARFFLAEASRIAGINNLGDQVLKIDAAKDH
ncbi:hypothetical protein KW782_02915 [Candidatus Parcubacteria bacterium]|nr:hypothetical protein [Candidatus Parcubacteria bacterium]